MSTLDPIALRAAAPSTLERPAPHHELTWRPLTLEDADGLTALVHAVEMADEAPDRTSGEQIREALAQPWRDLATDSLAGVDAGGAVRAYALVDVKPGDTRCVRAFLDGAVHPQWRGRGLGRALLAWAEGRGRQLLAESGKDLPARLAVYVDADSRDRRRLYAAAGFSPIRWYTSMRRDLAAPLPEPRPLAEGLRLVPWSPEIDDAVRLAHNEAFADHWGSEPHTPESWTHHGSHFVPAWSFAVVTGPDGTTGAPEVVAYLVSSRTEQDWPVRGYSFGYTDLLGVRPAYRGTGLAVALLRAAMEAYRQDGMEYACLSVDSANPSGAHELYDRLGYEAVHQTVLYTVEF